MTVQEIIEDAWEGLGKPTNLTPGEFDTEGELTFDISSDGGSKLLGWLNRAYKFILSWKDERDNNIIKFRNLEKTMYHKAVIKTGTLTSGGTEVAVLDIGTSGDTGRYEGWTFEITGGTGDGQVRRVIAFSGSTKEATVNDAFSTTPDSTSTYKLTKNYIQFRRSTDPFKSDDIELAPEKVVGITGVRELENLTELGYRQHGETYVANYEATAIPSLYWLEGDRIYFNYAPDEEYKFEIKYLENPTDFTTGGEIPAIPEKYHEAISLWMQWRGYRQRQFYTAAYATKKELYDLMRGTPEQGERDFDDEESRMEVI